MKLDKRRLTKISFYYGLISILVLGIFLVYIPEVHAADTSLTEDYEASSLTINPGDTFTTNGYDVIIKGNITIQGTLNATNGVGGTSTISLTGNWNSTNGSFTNTNSEVVFSGTSQSITSDNENFNNLTIAPTGTTVTVLDTLTVNGSLTIDNGYRMKVGTYTGDGNDDRSISGLGFEPDLVTLRKSNSPAQMAVFKTDDMGDNTLEFANSAVAFVNGIQSLDSDGFTVGDDIRVNENTHTYHWQAFKNNGNNYTNDLYIGNGNDNRDVVSGLSFHPGLVVIKGDTARYGIWKPDSQPGDAAMQFDNIGTHANTIQAINIDGFQIGSDPRANENGSTYYWFAFEEMAGWMDDGTYTGDAVDNRSITGIGFQPDLLWIGANPGYHRVWKPSTLGGDAAMYFSTVVSTAINNIQALEIDGFQIGTNGNVNANGQTYYYTAWKATSSSTLNFNGQDIDIDGDVNINDLGTLTTGASTINVGGDWTNNGTVNANGSQVIFDGTAAQSITSGGDSFDDLTITNSSPAGVTFTDSLTLTGTFTCNTPGATITFHAGSTYTFPSIDINGTEGNHITLQSDNPGNPWFLIVTEPNPEVSYVDVSDCDASGGNEITNYGGLNLDGNDNWYFPTQASEPELPYTGS